LYWGSAFFVGTCLGVSPLRRLQRVSDRYPE